MGWVAVRCWFCITMFSITKSLL